MRTLILLLLAVFGASWVSAVDATHGLTVLYEVHNERAKDAVPGNGTIDVDEIFMFALEGDVQGVESYDTLDITHTDMTAYVTVQYRGNADLTLTVDTPGAYYNVFDGLQSVDLVPTKEKGVKTLCVRHRFANNETFPMTVTVTGDARYVYVEGIIVYHDNRLIPAACP